MNIYYEVLPKFFTLGAHVATIERDGKLYRYTVLHQRTGKLVEKGVRKHLHEAIKAAARAAKETHA